MNQLILNMSSCIEEKDVDYLSYYINFLKTIANKLDTSTLSLFFHQEKNNFPLLDEASRFFKFQDVMIKNTSRNIFLSIIKLNYEPMIQYICNIPRITDLILFADNIKRYIISLTNINISKNNINNNNNELRMKEIEENLIEDILFMQDILSLGIQKINYILINCLFSIPLQYLFNCIITHNKVNLVFYILNLILKNIRNECINNLIFFVLYSSQIHIRINENIANQESEEIYNLLYLNKFISYQSSFSNIIFEEYIILVYNQNFLRSIRYIKEEEKTFQEIKDISNYIKGKGSNKKNDINIGVKLISEVLRQGNKLNKVIKKMEAYHSFISRITGINIGISFNDANFSFLKIIYDNLLIYRNNNLNLKKDILLQENIIKKECLYFIDCNNPFDNQNLYINQVLLILQIINSNKISNELKKYLCLNNHVKSEENEELKKSKNTDEGLHISDEPQDNLRNSKNNFNELKENDENNIINDINFINSQEKNIYQNMRYEVNNEFKSSITDNNRENIIRDFFGISDNKTDYIKINLNYFGEENNSSPFILLSKPVDNDNNDNYNNKNQIILNKIKMNFEDFDFNNNNLNRIFFIYNSKCSNEENLNIISHGILLQKIINIIFNNDKLLSIINIRLSLELIENLILGSNNPSYYEQKYKQLFFKKYIKTLDDINTILLKSNSTKTKIYKYAYQYFEESFNLNKKKISNILNECINNESSYLLFNINNNNKDNNIKNKKFKKIDFPAKEHESLQCLFQLLVGLYDLKILLDFDKNNNQINSINNVKHKSLMRDIEFPLQLVNSNLDIGKNIYIKELKINPVPIIYKSKDGEYPNFYIFTYLNYLFIVSEKSDSFLIKDRIPLRQIVAYDDRGEPRALYLLKEDDDSETTLFFDNVLKASSMKENINNAIKLANVKEFSEVKKLINNLKCT